MGSFYSPQTSGYTAVTSTLKAFNAATVIVGYRDTASSGSDSKTVTATNLNFDLTEGFDEQILAGSVRFRLGNDTFVDRGGTLYRNVDPANNSGIASGTVRYGTGAVELTSWTPNVDNTLLLRSLATTTDLPPINHISFRTPLIPVRPQSITVVVASLDHGNLTLTFDEFGKVETDYAHGTVNYDTGFVDIYFYKKTKKTDNLWILDEPWYDPLLEYTDFGNTVWINVPVWVDASSVRYNAIAYTYIPLDSEILGLSATRLPIDGRVPIFRVGGIGVISASKAFELPDSTSGKTYSLADQRISWLELEDSAGTKVPYSMYVVDYDYGKFTLNGDFALNTLISPLTAKYRYQDMLLIRDVQINGQLTFTKPVTHNYDVENSIVGSALVINDMQARYTRKFVQPTWSNLWADEAVGGAISANYNDALYPIAVTNNGNIQERWALVFTGDGTNFRCVGEYSGQIGTGSVNTDFAPINPVTSVPYFKVKKEGWGSGWASGNVMRFNTIAATYPVWVIRTVKQSEPTVLSDQFQIMLRGDIDRVV